MTNAPQIQKTKKKLPLSFIISFRHHHITSLDKILVHSCGKICSHPQTVPAATFPFECIAVTGGSARGPNSGEESPESIHSRFFKSESNESIQSRYYF